jgi:hypothetical protein
MRNQNTIILIIILLLLCYLIYRDHKQEDLASYHVMKMCSDVDSIMNSTDDLCRVVDDTKFIPSASFIDIPNVKTPMLLNTDDTNNSTPILVNIDSSIPKNLSAITTSDKGLPNDNIISHVMTTFGDKNIMASDVSKVVTNIQNNKNIEQKIMSIL